MNWRRLGASAKRRLARQPTERADAAICTALGRPVARRATPSGWAGPDRAGWPHGVPCDAISYVAMRYLREVACCGRPRASAALLGNVSGTACFECPPRPFSSCSASGGRRKAAAVLGSTFSYMHVIARMRRTAAGTLSRWRRVSRTASALCAGALIAPTLLRALRVRAWLTDRFMGYLRASLEGACCMAWIAGVCGALRCTSALVAAGCAPPRRVSRIVGCEPAGPAVEQGASTGGTQPSGGRAAARLARVTETGDGLGAIGFVRHYGPATTGGGAVAGGVRVHRRCGTGQDGAARHGTAA
jgi:hypothetical protein